MKPVRIAFTAAVAAAFCLGGVARAADEYGTITGKFVFKGEVPEQTLAVKKGDATVKDAAVCAVQDMPSEGLIVDPETKGIKNVFVYMPTAPKEIHPDLAASETKELDFDQKNCRFIPHAMVVRLDQTVIVKSDDPISHNTHTHPLKNKPENFSVAANDRVGQNKLQFKVAERIPVKVLCDIHPSMSSYWLVTDHPYTAISAEDGTFTIEKVPAGEHQFFFWQEQAGYVKNGKERTWDVKVEPGQTTDLGVIEVSPEALKIAGN